MSEGLSPAGLGVPRDGSEWATRTCSPVTPTQVSGFLSWVVAGCDGRPGWWLCPAEAPDGEG